MSTELTALAEQVAGLSEDTVALTEEVVSQKARLIAAADTATAEAASATLSATEASTSEDEALDSAERAEAAADRAEEVTGLDTVEEAVALALAESYQYAPTKADFFARAEQRKRNGAGSGFTEWGKYYEDANNQPVNEGIWCTLTIPNLMWMGRSPTDSIAEGISRTPHPISVVDGVQHRIGYTAHESRNYINFPDAPDGTKTYNSSTGEVVQHVDSATAFAFADVDSNVEVIISRKDLMFLETWHEAVSDKDAVFPLGNVQYDVTTYDDISLTAFPTQGYCAFGEWDTDTVGNYAVWSTLSEEEQKTFLDDPDNNLYYDSEADELIQVRYRIRVVEGLGDTGWFRALPSYGSGTALVYREGDGTGLYVIPRGGRTDPADYSISASNGYMVNALDSLHNDPSDKGSWYAALMSDSTLNNSSMIPIALVQRLNQGAYHPVYNPSGCGSFISAGGTGAAHWYEPLLNEPNTAANCFVMPATEYPYTDGYQYISNSLGRSGNINAGASLSGRNDQYGYYDAIYAGLVEDLRLSANKQDYNRLLVDRVRSGIAGETRGTGKIPFTKAGTSASLGIVMRASGNSGYGSFPKTLVPDITGLVGQSWYVSKTSGIVKVVIESITSRDDNYWDIRFTNITLGTDDFLVMHYFTSVGYNSLPWVDIIGDPERIAATFPEGVVGRWIDTLPDDSVTYNFNRKAIDTISNKFTDDDGATWGESSSFNSAFNSTTNSVTRSDGTGRIYLVQYETLSNFTKADDNRAVVGGLGDVHVMSHSAINLGNRLLPSLIGDVGKNLSSGNVLHAVPLLSCSVDPMSGLIADGWDNDPTTHTPLGLVAPYADSGAVKVLPHLVEKDGLLYVQYHATELVYTAGGTVGNEWGDTAPATDYTNAYGEITIVDDETTKTDLNGVTAKVVTHTEQFPVGIADYTQSL